VTTLRLGDLAPDFTADTTEGPIRFHDWKRGSWAVLFSHPADFTPVCTTELGRTAALADDFARRDVKLLAVSVDPLEDHLAWAPDIADVGGTDLTFPIVADEGREVAELYGMLHPGEGDTSTVRAVFVVDPADRIRLILVYPKSVGRSFAEILRAIDALQLTDRHPVSTPADWSPGQRLIAAPTLSTDEVHARFDEVEEVRPYLRFVAPPDEAA
jgi:alkyl hydroperoxide reductase subunit AhpC